MLLSSLQIIGCSYQACFVVVLVRSCYHAFLLRERWGRNKVNSHCFEVSCSFPSFYAHIIIINSFLAVPVKKKKKKTISRCLYRLSFYSARLCSDYTVIPTLLVALCRWHLSNIEMNGL